MKIKPEPVSISTDVFLLKTEQIVILRIRDEEYFARHFQSTGVVNPCINWVLSRANILITKII